MINTIQSKKTKLILMIIVITAIIGLCLCINLNNERTVEKVNLSLSLTREYKTLEDLKNAAEVITQVEIDNSKSFTYNDVPFTISDAKLIKTYKGNIFNDKINLLETGGQIDNKEYSPEGNDVLKKREKAILFLKKYEGPITDDAYVILGVYQGKYKISSDDNQLIIPNGAPQLSTNIQTIESSLN